MDRSGAARAIGAARTKAELTTAYRAYIGRRREFCVLGPEYTGCYNTGERARIASYGNNLYAVGTESEPQQVLPTTRAAAIRAFITRAWRAQEYNLHAREEIETARTRARSKDPSERLGAAMILTDHNLL